MVSAASSLVISVVPPSLIVLWFLKCPPQCLLSWHITHVPMASEERLPVFVLQTQLQPHCAFVTFDHPMKIILAPLTHFFSVSLHSYMTMSVVSFHILSRLDAFFHCLSVSCSFIKSTIFLLFNFPLPAALLSFYLYSTSSLSFSCLVTFHVIIMSVSYNLLYVTINS